MGLLAGAGALVYKLLRKKDEPEQTTGEPVFSSGVIRNAGQDEQKDTDKQGEWDKVDEANDASFPASDPPAVP
ncbi:MAG: hypothetical protein E2598_08410 [Sphingobium sp.]|nr:hypothetical protein [Sphingobium sp.]